jgi:hypothetical protein
MLYPVITLASAFNDKVERKLSLPGSQLELHDSLQGLPDTSQVSLHKNNK